MKKLYSLTEARPRTLSERVEEVRKEVLSEYSRYTRRLREFKHNNPDADLETLECWMFIDATDKTVIGTLDECLGCAGFSKQSSWRDCKQEYEQDINKETVWCHTLIDWLLDIESLELLEEKPCNLPKYIPHDVDKLIRQEEMGYSKHKGILLRQGFTFVRSSHSEIVFHPFQLSL